MSYNLDGSISSSRVMYNSGVTGAAFPMTMSCWCFCTNGVEASLPAATNMNMISVMNSSRNHWHSLMFVANASSINTNIRVGTVAAGGTINSSTSLLGNVANRWVHAAGVFETDLVRYCIVDGDKSTPTNTRRSTVGIVDMVMGGTATAGSGQSTTRQFQGYLAEVGIWNIKLTDEDIKSLRVGAKPTAVRPDYLVHYVPFVQNTNDIVYGQSPKTVQGATPLAVHPTRYG